MWVLTASRGCEPAGKPIYRLCRGLLNATREDTHDVRFAFTKGSSHLPGDSRQSPFPMSPSVVPDLVSEINIDHIVD